MNLVFFWTVLGLFLLSWLVYPLLLVGISVFFRKYSDSWREPDEWPSVSILVAARNEEKTIAARIRNLLEQDYPGHFEILIGSDGSDDGTESIVNSFRENGVVLYASRERVGKPSIVQILKDMSSGKILVFSDADTVFTPQTVKELVIPYTDPSVGCVDGSRRNSLADDTCESMYWKYETTIKKLSSCAGAVVGATGAVFSVRKKVFKPLTPKRADDFELSVMTRIQGYSCVFNSKALAAEPSPDDRSQYRRIVRIASWMFKSCILLMGQAVKNRRYLLFLQLFVHKILRWFSGLLFASATIFAGFLSGERFYSILFLLICLFNLLAFIGFLLKRHFPSKLLFPYYFWLMNIAASDGILRTLSGHPIETWDNK